ncbi:uncharacterized protein LOC129231519 isoform X2 [Uloborus diversus]|nr:uncharacterized protein LOC129231519 isoform X2 [Uloborus diversus]
MKAKPNEIKPSNQCPVCPMVWNSDQSAECNKRIKKTLLLADRARRKLIYQKLIFEYGLHRKIKNYIHRELHVSNFFDENLKQCSKEYFESTTGEMNVEEMIKVHLKNLKIPTDIKDVVLDDVHRCFQKLNEEIKEKLEAIQLFADYLLISSREME